MTVKWFKDIRCRRGKKSVRVECKFLLALERIMLNYRKLYEMSLGADSMVIDIRHQLGLRTTRLSSKKS